MATLPVILKPVGSSQAYAAPHSLNVKEIADAGKTITFSAVDSGFAVVIPKANELFADWEKDFWCCSIRDFSYKETPKIKSGLGVNAKWECYVYCEKTQNWAQDAADAPPKIIIIVNQ